MKKTLRLLSLPLVLVLLAPQTWAAEESTGYINVTEIFNGSTYVKKANKELQDNVKKMDASIKKDQLALQEKVKDFQNQKNEVKKRSMAKEVNDEQARLTKLAQDYQAKVQTEQNQGMEKFTQLVKTATEKVAKDKNIQHVLNSNNLVYTDGSWVDLTKDVAAEMEKQ